MKKLSAALLALILVVSASATVFGATKNDAESKISSSFAYLSKEAFDDGCTVDSNLKDFYVMTCAGADVNKYTDGFIASVKEALDAGKITSADTAVLVTGTLLNLGIDVKSFNGYDLTQLVKSFGADSFASPFSLVYGIAAADALNDNELKAAYTQKLAGYYEIGKGTDFWGGYGTSPDDLGTLIVGLSYSKQDYSQIIEDALNLLETYYTPQGYSNYGANADSTALALAAYSALGQKEKADSIYDILTENFYDAETGGFKAEYDPLYATTDAVYGISFYLPLADESNKPVTDETEKKPAAGTDKKSEKQQTSAKKASEKSPATGTAITTAAIAFALSACTAAALRKKEN